MLYRVFRTIKNAFSNDIIYYSLTLRDEIKIQK